MDSSSSTPTKRVISRFDPLQLGKVFAIVYGGLDLLCSPILILMALAGSHQGGGIAGMFGIGFAIAFPIIYAVLGFIGGLLGACIYNIAAKMVGGIRVEVEVASE